MESFYLAMINKMPRCIRNDFLLKFGAFAVMFNFILLEVFADIEKNRTRLDEMEDILISTKRTQDLHIKKFQPQDTLPDVPKSELLDELNEQSDGEFIAL